jgi:hypothetical protein
VQQGQLVPRETQVLPEQPAPKGQLDSLVRIFQLPDREETKNPITGTTSIALLTEIVQVMLIVETTAITSRVQEMATAPQVPTMETT